MGIQGKVDLGVLWIYLGNGLMDFSRLKIEQ